MVQKTTHVKSIIKRNGTEVPFDSNKIRTAIFKANSHIVGEKISDEQLDEITLLVVAVHDEAGVTPTVEQVQDTVEEKLIEFDLPKTAKAYILYRAEHQKMREMDANLMKIYEHLTFRPSADVDLKRENANIDADTAMGTMLKYGSEGAKAFYDEYVIPKEIAQAHLNGDIHIHDKDFYALTETCCQINLLKLFHGGFSTGHGYLREPNDIRSYSALACIAIQANQNEMHGGQSIPNFDYCMAPGVAKTYRKLYFKALTQYLQLHESLSSQDAAALVQAVKQDLGTDITLSTSEEYGKRLVQYLPAHQQQGGYQPIYAQTAEAAHRYACQTAWDETDNATYQAMEALVHNLNTMNSRAGAQVPFSSINFGTDTSPEGRMVSEKLMLAQEAGLGNGETPIFPILIFKVKEGINYNPGDPNYDLFKLACRVSAKRLFPNFEFLDAPFNLQYYEEGKPETEVATMGCRTRVMGNVNGPEIATGRGNNSFTSINLVRIGIKHGQVMLGEPDIDGFYAELDEKIDIVIEQLLERLAIQAKKKVKNFPFLMGQGVWLGSEELEWEDTLEEVVKQGTLTMGFIGLAECLKALIGEHHGESEYAQKMGLEIVGHMRQRMDEATEKYHLNFSLIATPAEGLSGRFTRIDKKIFGELEGITDREYYTNSFHIPVYYHIRAFDKIRLEGPYHALTNGGHISYVEVDGDPSNNLEAFEAIVRCMKENNIGYGSINHPVDRDPCCGYSGVIEGHICPKCGRDDSKSEYKFEKIRRITGYLVGTVDRFNNAKKEEESDRVKHA